MSKRRRDRGDSPNDLLGELRTNETSEPAFGGFTASGIADQAYGSSVGHDDPFAQVGRGREKILRKSIEEIHPNASQPRRAVPSALRQYWNQDPSAESLANLFSNWLREVEVERGTNFPLDDYLEGGITPRVAQIESDQLDQIGSSESTGPKELALMRVVALAASIKRDGLTNPISVAQVGYSFEIETGERRWLAYHLLNWRSSGTSDEWSKIPVRIVDGVSIWRQASENNARADLNAIGKARQFSLLLMDLLTSDEQIEFQGFDAFHHEQGFYAQVADGSAYRVPRNRGEDMINAMGLENPVQLRQYRALLRLPQPVWEWADDLNWTESFIRKEIQGKAQSEDECISLAVKQALAEGYFVSSVMEYATTVSEDVSQKAPRHFSYKDFTSSLGQKVYRYLSKLDGKDKERTIAYLEEMIASLKENQ